MQVLRTLERESVQCCVTSPPYWNLRNYGIAGQIGLEATPEEYVQKMVEVFREVKRVLRNDGTLFINLGDTYAGSNQGHGTKQLSEKQASNTGTQWMVDKKIPRLPNGLKPKDLCGIPWRVAFALQADGWWLRQDIIWSKKNPMPESVTDRCTKSHEYIFLLTKSAKYFYDAEAIKEESEWAEKDSRADGKGKHLSKGKSATNQYSTNGVSYGKKIGEKFYRNKRSVWTISPAQFSEAHFATFPEELPLICIKAGTSEKGACKKCWSPWDRIIEKEKTGRGGTKSNLKDGIHERSSALSLAQKRQAYRAHGMEGPPPTKILGWQPTCNCNTGDPVPCVVLDPFSGAGTTCLVAKKLNRRYIGIELNPEYVKMSERRIEMELGTLL